MATPIPFLRPFESLPPRRTYGRVNGTPRPRFLAEPRNDSKKGSWYDREKGTRRALRGPWCEGERRYRILKG